MKQDLIRNFAIVAHIDHGKSTLADRLLEITKTISKEKMQEQFLDQNPISRKRGITIKLAPVRMIYSLDGNDYILNLIDTPGHVDFSYEVSRTLAACEGVVLLVDATQGIQAQTVAHFEAAKKQNLTIVPVINKIDLPNARTEEIVKMLNSAFGFEREEIIFISAKTGENVELLLKKIIEKIPSPGGNQNSGFRALVFDAVYDEYRGVVAFIRVVDGKVKNQDKISFFQSNSKTIATEVGYFSPFLKKSDVLETGEIGYLVTGIKDIRKTNVGDTIVIEAGTEPLSGYQNPKPMVFFGVYPKNTNDFIHLKEGLERLALKDAALSFSSDYSQFLGSGFRVGFLGLLHAEVVKDRLKAEEGVEPLFTKPQVLYRKEGDIFFEPYINLMIYSPLQYINNIIPLCQKRKGKLIEILYHESYAVLKYEMPYGMLIKGISSELKSATSGFASIDYELLDFREADLVNLEIKVNDNSIDVLSELVYKEEAPFLARERVEKLKETLTRQQFRQIIHGVIENRIIAKEEIPPFRKDVIAKLSGGDRTRKDKLLKKQKKGKERLLHSSKISIPQEALFSFLD